MSDPIQNRRDLRLVVAMTLLAIIAPVVLQSGLDNGWMHFWPPGVPSTTPRLAPLIKDPLLELRIREQEGILGMQPLTRAHLAKINVLAIDWSQIQSLAGLENCRNLTELRHGSGGGGVGECGVPGLTPGNIHYDINLLERARSNAASSGHVFAIRDLGPLRGLKQLEVLQLEQHEIRDLSPLAGLSQLHTIDLPGNPITDIAPLAKMPRLRNLSLGGIPGLTDPRQLAPLRGLVALDLSVCSQGFGYALQGTTVAPGQVLQLGPRAQGPAWLTDLSALGNLGRLHVLNLNGQPIGNSRLLEGARSLKGLGLDRTGVTDFSMLPVGAPLTHLTALENGITHIEMLQGYPALATLVLASNRVSDLGPLAACTNLDWLDVSTNQVTDLEPLAHCGKLRVLNVSHNRIAELSAISSTLTLTDLIASDNRIVDLSPIRGHPTLYQVSLSENQIVDIAPLLSMPKLVVAHLDRNQVSGVPALLTQAQTRVASPQQGSLQIGLAHNPNALVTQPVAEQFEEAGIRLSW